MSFFDRKEEVMDIVLTPQGRKLLSEGKLNPAYYDFFDDDIIYDSFYASGTEEAQSDIEPRILDDLRLKQQSFFGSVEEHTRLSNDRLRHASSEPIAMKPLGTAESNSEDYPAWSIKMHTGEFLSASQGRTDSSLYEDTRPQLNYEVEFRTRVHGGDGEVGPGVPLPGELEFEEGPLGVDELFSFSTLPFPDGSYVSVDGEPLFLEILEENTQYMKENFEIEVYMVEGWTGVFEKLIPLRFSEDEESDISSDEVEYWMDILIDDEIDERFLCDIFGVSRIEDVFIPKIYDCGEQVQEQERDTYIVPTDPEGEIC